jgi:hypothetical protein
VAEEAAAIEADEPAATDVAEDSAPAGDDEQKD